MEPEQDRVAKLSPQQRACLTLLYQHYDRKEIARRLGISPETVKEYLAAARARLQVTTSLQAARIYAAYQDTPPAWGEPPAGDAPTADVPSDDLLSQLNAAADRIGPRLHEMTVAYEPTAERPGLMELAKLLIAMLPLRHGRARHNDMSIAAVLVAILLAVVLALGVVGLFAGSFLGLSGLALNFHFGW